MTPGLLLMHLLPLQQKKIPWRPTTRPFLTVGTEEPLSNPSTISQNFPHLTAPQIRKKRTIHRLKRTSEQEVRQNEAQLAPQNRPQRFSSLGIKPTRFNASSLRARLPFRSENGRHFGSKRYDQVADASNPMSAPHIAELMPREQPEEESSRVTATPSSRHNAVGNANPSPSTPAPLLPTTQPTPDPQPTTEKQTLVRTFLDKMHIKSSFPSPNPSQYPATTTQPQPAVQNTGIRSTWVYTLPRTWKSRRYRTPPPPVLHPSPYYAHCNTAPRSPSTSIGSPVSGDDASPDDEDGLQRTLWGGGEGGGRVRRRSSFSSWNSVAGSEGQEEWRGEADLMLLEQWRVQHKVLVEDYASENGGSRRDSGLVREV